MKNKICELCEKDDPVSSLNFNTATKEEIQEWIKMEKKWTFHDISVHEYCLASFIKDLIKKKKKK